MCQGAVVSVFQFKVGKRTKNVVCTGIGSHKGVAKDNKAKLEKAGWNENLPGQKVFSIESDFSAWNKFTLVSGEPDKKELKLLKSAYKEIAGSASALIRHVLKCGKIDDALLRLLTAPAWAEYEKVKAQALAEYKKVTAPALAEYEKVKAPAWISLFCKPSNRIGALQ